MKKFIKYMLWNIFFVGGFFYCLHFDINTILYKIAFSVEFLLVLILFFVVQTSSFNEFKKNLKKDLSKGIPLYKVLFEIIFVVCAIYKNQHLVALFMASSFILNVLIRMELNKENGGI